MSDDLEAIDADDEHGGGHDSHDEHDGHEEHEPEDPRWVLVPLVVGLLIGAVLLAVFGLVPGAPAFT